MKPEVLAPAGNFQALVAAVRSGADAVYLGTGDFNARRNAGNFSSDELRKAVELCHLHNVKCHVALNTLVGDRELPALKKAIKDIYESNADAVILQDLGVAELVREACPDIELHASTQLSTGTPKGIERLSKLGFSRAVLPRELSLSEIKEIAKASPIELEVFVHGALCMSVSGQCLLSAMLGSRSGNRGLCAQPCRLPFSVKGGTGTDLSLKDLSLIEHLGELSEMGISSFKIEGRMKRPEYVAAAVTACREALDGGYSSDRRSELEALFSRSGFTDGYYFSKLGRDMFGKREKENVTSATAELLKKYERLYEKEQPVHKVDFLFSAKLCEKPTLSAKSGSLCAFAVADFECQKAINKPITEETVEAQLKKCGGTVFEAQSVECDIKEDISVPVSCINALRREVLEELSAKIISREKRECLMPDIKLGRHTPSQKRRVYLSFNDIKSIPDSIEYDRIFLPVNTPSDIIEKYSAGVTVPRGIFGSFDTVVEKIKKSKARYALCNTLDGVEAARLAGVEIIGGPFLNIYNSVSILQSEKLGVSELVLSHELKADEISSLSGNIDRGAVVYGHTPLMLTRNCPVKNAKNCSECKMKSCLTDRKGISFPIICENGFSQLLNSRPTYMLDRLSEIGNVDFDFIMFTVENKAQVQGVLEAYGKHSAPNGEFTRGLFYRGVE